MRWKMCICIITIVSCWGKTLCIPQHIINEFKASVLPLFGMKDRPKLQGQKPYIPEELQRLYETQNGLDYDTASLPLPGLHTRSANTVRSFLHVESPIDEKFLHHDKFRLKFDVSSIPKTETLKAAEIKISRESLPPSAAPVYRLLVHDIVRRGVKGKHAPIMRVIDSQLVDTRKNSTVSVDVSPAVQRWMEDPKGNHGVLVELRPSKKAAAAASRRHLRLRREAGADWHQKQPLLYTYTDDGKNRQAKGMEMTKLRPKRGANRNRNRKGDGELCRRKQMYVDFREVGWSDWIVAPPGYDAYYCDGLCEFPMPEHLNTTNHAIVQALVHSSNPKEVPQPCCVPTSLSSISMLYVASDNNVILKNYKEMVVVGCGCR